MTIRYTKIIRTHVYALLLCISPLSFSAPVINIDDESLLDSARLQHDYYFKERSVVSTLVSYTDPESHHAAKQFQRLLDAKAITETPELKVDEIFLAAFNELNILTSKQFSFLLTAFTSPIYQASPDQQLLVSLYHAVAYGSAAQITMLRNMNWNLENSVLWFLGNFAGYYALKSKPHYQKFLDSTYANGGFPALYNPPHSYFFSTLMAGSGEDYFEDLGNELGHALLRAFSCNFNGEALRNQMGFLENCKVDKHAGYTDLKDLRHDGSYLLEAEATTGLSKMRLTPAPGYVKDFTGHNISQEEYSYKSLHHVITRVVEDKTEGAMFYVLYRGADKYQFFTVGIYKGFLSLSFVVDHHAPTPVLSHLIPLRGMNLDQIVDGIDAVLHQDRTYHNLVPDLQGVWMISSQ